MDQNSAGVRHFLIQYFDDVELTILCFDYFPDVYRDFSQGMPKSQKVQLLLNYCQQHGRWADLMAALQRERPQAYDAELAAITVTTTPQPPADRHNPRQIFISYAHQDVEFAHRLAHDLKAHGWQIWIAPESIKPGEKWVEAIERGLAESGIFLSVLTNSAITSRWARSETNVAIELEHQGKLHFIPLQVEPIDVPLVWRAYQYVSFLNGYQKGLKALLDRLQSEEEEEPEEAGPLPPSQATTESVFGRYLRYGRWAGVGGLFLLILLLFMGPRLGWWGQDGAGELHAGTDTLSTETPPVTAMPAAKTSAPLPSPSATESSIAAESPTPAPTQTRTALPTASLTPTSSPFHTPAPLPPTTSPPVSQPSSAPVNVSVKWVEAGAYTDIYLVYADGNEVNLTNDTHRENNAVLSPDRTKVAFERGAPTQIFVINVDGTGSTQLTFNPHSQVRPEWSGDGTEIFFTSWEDDKRYAVSIISKQIRPLE